MNFRESEESSRSLGTFTSNVEIEAIRNRDRDNDYYSVFGVRHRTSLDSVDSYAQIRTNSSADIGTDYDGFEYNLKNQTKKRKKSVIVTGEDANKRAKELQGQTPKATLYAGITHSDLDMITSRPPLMHQMHALEWVWLHSTVSHRVIIMLLAVLFSVSMINFGYSLKQLLFEEENVKNPYVCRTPACRNLAKRLRNSMNESVNPCDDFYGFVCGSSEMTPLSPHEEFYWHPGFDVDRITYDFHHSPSLGRMLKKTNKFPETLVLDMYKGCLHKKNREDLGLQPFYEVLKSFKLYDINSSMPLTTDNVIETMAKIIGHTIKGSAIIDVKYYKDKDGNIRSFLKSATPETVKPGAVYHYGYVLYCDTVKKAFKLLTELQISDNELDVIAHDIVCLDMFFKDGNYGPHGPFDNDMEEMDVAKEPCYVHRGTGNLANPKANFGNPVNTPFNYTSFISHLYGVANPFRDDFLSSHNPRLDIHTDSTYMDIFEKEFERSAPIRIMRYLQWRVFYFLSFELNEEAGKTMIDVSRHNYLGPVASCFFSLFTSLPFAAVNRFWEQSEEAVIRQGKKKNSVDVDVDELSEQVKIMISDMILKRNSFKHYEDKIRAQPNFYLYQGMDINLLRHVMDAIMLKRVIQLDTESFHAKHFSNYTHLYENMYFMEHEHVANLVKMGFRIHQWKTNPKYTSVYFSILPLYRAPVMINRILHTLMNGDKYFQISLPIGLTEVPFFRDGLYVSDVSGLGLTRTGAFLQLFFAAILQVKKAQPVAPAAELAREFAFSYLSGQHANFSHYNESELKSGIRTALIGLSTYTEDLMRDFKNQTPLWPWKMGGEPWGPIRHGHAGWDILQTLLIDQSRYHLMHQMVDNHFSDPKYKFESKLVLPKLEKYNAKQLFYMTLVQRRCEVVGPIKLERARRYGPLVQALRNNVVLSNLNDFSKTFNCPAGSPMNVTAKVSFFDQ